MSMSTWMANLPATTDNWVLVDSQSGHTNKRSNYRMNYVNSIFRQILEDLPGEVTIINGRVRHPQSQGVVEKGNAKVEEMLACHFQSEKADGESQQPLITGCW